MARTHLAEFSLAFVGIGIFRFWYQYNLYSLHSLTDYGTSVAWINILRGFVIAAFLLVGHLIGRPSARLRSALVWGSLILMSLASLLNFLELTTGLLALEIPRYVACGVGLVWGGGMWMDFFARLRPSRAFLYLASGLALSCLLSLIGGYLSPEVMGLIDLFVPAFSVLAFWQAIHLLDVREGAADHAMAPAAPLPPSDVARLGWSFSLFAFVLGVALGFPDGEPRDLSQTVRSIHQLALVAVLVLLVWHVLARGRRMRFSGVWLFINVLLIVSVILLVSEGAVARELSTALMLSAESFFYSFVFLTSYEVGRRWRRGPMVALGLFYGSALFAMGAGRLASAVAGTLPSGIFVMAAAMSLLVIVELIVALRLASLRGEAPLFYQVGCETRGAPEPTTEGSAPSPASVPREAGKPEPCELGTLAATFGLNDAERAIAALIARGRSRAFIAGELGYSENTVRNYTRNLYRKLGIHNKQELIDLLER